MVLVDTSLSMDLHDSAQPGTNSQGRLQQVVDALDKSGLVEQLRKVHEVAIYRFDSDIFYSDAYFTSKDGMLQLDMRPSDAIALAVRTKSPVYINKTILATMGKNIC